MNNYIEREQTIEYDNSICRAEHAHKDNMPENEMSICGVRNELIESKMFNCRMGNMGSSHWGYNGAINIESKIEFQDSTPSKSIYENEYIKYKALSITGTYTQVKQTLSK